MDQMRCILEYFSPMPMTMNRVFFTLELEGVATFWRVHRKDGVTLGFTSHDRDLWFDGVLHRAAPGMLPSAIRRSADLTDDSADVQGALAHDSISSADLAAGKYDGAAIESGAVDWENLDRTVLYTGTLGSVSVTPTLGSSDGPILRTVTV